ncbi:hypothetical protein BDR04DRAFT_710632 [Suillus decipiens]|nr:hypothetical protein BDR04DRAFT_710632 [Suillus decipiens]
MKILALKLLLLNFFSNSPGGPTSMDGGGQTQRIIQHSQLQILVRILPMRHSIFLQGPPSLGHRLMRWILMTRSSSQEKFLISHLACWQESPNILQQLLDLFIPLSTVMMTFTMTSTLPTNPCFCSIMTLLAFPLHHHKFQALIYR